MLKSQGSVLEGLMKAKMLLSRAMLKPMSVLGPILSGIGPSRV